MQQVNIWLALEHPSPERLASQTCRHVLMSDLEDDAYIGDFSRILTPDIADRLLEQAYEKVIRLVNHINALKGARNSLSPIYRLPPEVLLSIFKRCTIWDHYSHNKLAFSQVCTSWRRLALADPTLWTLVNFSWPELASLMVERAQQAPLSISITDSDHVDFRLDIQLERNRVQSVRAFLLCSYDAAVHMSDYLSGHFPSLRQLDIRIETGLDVVPRAALVAPVLQELSLYGLALRDWDTHLISNLTSLNLEYYNVIYSEPLWTLQHILAVLKLAPKLTSLRLCGLFGFNKDQEHMNADFESIQLSNLRSLFLMEAVFGLSEMLLLFDGAFLT